MQTNAPIFRSGHFLPKRIPGIFYGRSIMNWWCSLIATVRYMLNFLKNRRLDVGGFLIKSFCGVSAYLQSVSEKSDRKVVSGMSGWKRCAFWAADLPVDAFFGEPASVEVW